MKKLIVLSLIVIFAGSLHAEEPEPQSGIFLIKTDSLGVIMWTHKLEHGYEYVEDTLEYILDEAEIILLGRDQRLTLKLHTLITKDSTIGVLYRASWKDKVLGELYWERGLPSGDCKSSRFFPESHGFFYFTGDTCRTFYLMNTIKEGEIYITITQDCEGIPILKIPGMYVFSIFPSPSAYFQDVKPTVDSNYIFVGGIASTYTSGVLSEHNWDVWLVKTDSLGDTLWTRRYDGHGDDFGCWVYPTPDSGYVIFGTKESSSNNGTDAWLFKTDYEGNMIWERTYEGAVDEETGVWGFPDTDGGYLIIYPLVGT